MRKMMSLLLVFALALVLSCQQAPQTPQEKEQPKVVQPAPPGTIRASHILVSYKGVDRTEATRTKAEAQKLAQDLLARVRKGENFAELAKTYSDCPSAPVPGIVPFPTYFRPSSYRSPPAPRQSRSCASP